MQSQRAPARKAAEEEKRRNGQRQSAGGTADTSAQGSSGTQPADTRKRSQGHRNDAGNRPAPRPSSDRGPGPSSSQNGGVRHRQDQQPERRKEHRRDYSTQRSAGPRRGSVGPTRGEEAQRGAGPRRGSERPRDLAPRTERSPDQQRRVRPGPSKGGLIIQVQAVRRPSPKPHSDSGHGPYNARNSREGGRQEHRPDSRMQQRRAPSPQHSVGPRHGQKWDVSGGATRGNPPRSGMAPRYESRRPRDSAPHMETSPSQRHRVQPGPGKDGLNQQQLQAVRRPCPQPDSDSRHGSSSWRSDGMGRRQAHRPDSRMEQTRAYRASPDTYKQYRWHRSDAGNRPSPQQSSDGAPGPSHGHTSDTRQRQDHQPERRGEQRRVYYPEQSAGPSQGQNPVFGVGATHQNQADSGTGPRRGTGRPPGSAPWPENMTDGRQPVWAVPGKDWLSLLPSTEEPMELEDVEEPMEVDPPPPEESWDPRSASLLSALQAHKERRRSARTTPYSTSRRLHRKH